VNRGKNDVLLDQYSVSVPGSGAPDVVRAIAEVLPGKRCSTNPATTCSGPSDCGGAACNSIEVSVRLVLYAFDFKAFIASGQCPTGERPGSILPSTSSAIVSFSAINDAGERFGTDAAYVSTFADFANCPSP
jgi:hypothetical protein